MQDVRMPLFCKECNKVMNKRLDDKMWRLYGHCFDCQIKIENKLRIEGKYEEWEKEKIKQNKIAFIKDQMQTIEEWKDMKAPEWYNQVGVNYPEAIEEYTKILNKLENKE